MKKFLESKEKEAIFGKSSKSEERRQVQREDGVKDIILTDDGMKASEGEGEKMDTASEEESDDDKGRERSDKEEERESEVADDNKEGHSRQGERKSRYENSGTSGEEARKEEKDSGKGGMSVRASESGAMRVLVAKMSELKVRLKEFTDRLEKEERERDRKLG